MLLLLPFEDGTKKNTPLGQEWGANLSSTDGYYPICNAKYRDFRYNRKTRRG